MAGADPSTVISDTAYASSWDGVTTIAPSKNAVYDAIQYGHEQVQMFPTNGAIDFYKGIKLGANGAQVSINFYCHDKVDCTEDVVFTFVMLCTSTDAAVQGTNDAGANETDNTETYDQTNIDNGVNDDLNTTANKVFLKTYTFLAADIANNDVLIYNWHLAEASRVVIFLSTTVAYTMR